MNLVYVQLGIAKYKFVRGSIKRSISIFPDLKHYLITDNAFYIRKLSSCVEIKAPSKNLLPETLDRRSVDSIFRNNYWNLTLIRLLEVINFQIKNNLNDVLHVESDVILFPNFPFKEIVKENKISWCVYGENLDVASIFYIPTPKDAKWIKGEVEKELADNPNSTDMMILNRIKRKYPDSINILPGSNNLHESYCEMAPLFTNTELGEQGISALKGIFDGITMGMWITGQDPKNDLGRYKIRDNSPYLEGATFIDPSQYEFLVSDKSQLLARLKCCGSTTNVWNLHVHSKNRRLLGLKWETELRKLCSLTESQNKFSILAVLWMLNNAYKSKNLSKFILGLPLSKSISRSANRFLNRR